MLHKKNLATLILIASKSTRLEKSTEKSNGTRVTRLGEFSPIGWLFYFGNFLKITEVAQIFALDFPRYKLCIDFDKKWVGPHFCQFQS
jgi:hypothetical protein